MTSIETCSSIPFIVPRMVDDLDATHLRELAAKCRRFSSNMSDQDTSAALRRMAAEYEALAESKDRASKPEPRPPISL